MLIYLTAFAFFGALVGWLGAVLLTRLSCPATGSVLWCVVASMLCWLIVGWRSTNASWPEGWLFVVLTLTSLAVPLIAADLRYQRLPNLITVLAYPLLAVALAMVIVNGKTATSWNVLIGGLLFAGLHYAVAVMNPTAMGMGDVKLAGSLGMVLGAVGLGALVVAAVLAAFVTALGGVIKRFFRVKWKVGVPHGPGLMIATWIITLHPRLG